MRKLLAIIMALPLFQSAAADLHVFAAASLKNAADLLAAGVIQRLDEPDPTGRRVRLTIGSGGRTR